ncbi:MAG TPA: anthranilate phosphoribosyltransferase [Gammaproteobacteria bacterium]|nr:anthranilate phosphoribosyltransferase [Gammaproteobacteria bacterium]
MEIKEAIQRLVDRTDLLDFEMTDVMHTIMTGGATPAQIGGFLIGLRMKGETVPEITAAAKVMRDLAEKVSVQHDNLVDTCGTGGDSSGTFNISTASAFVTAAAGARVAKHGNRSISSKSGSADVLEEAGVKLDITPEQVSECLQETGIGFMFAPAHHSAMKHAIGPRREMGVRTIFNILGPLTNPAGAPNQVIGVFSSELLEPIAKVLKNLGSRHVMVVHALDGLDEISIGEKTDIVELKNGQISHNRISPEDFDMQYHPLEQIRAESAQMSLQMIQDVLADKAGPARDIVSLNAGAAIYTAGIAATFKEGVVAASSAISSGAAREKLEQLIACTQRFA